MSAKSTVASVLLVASQLMYHTADGRSAEWIFLAITGMPYLASSVRPCFSAYPEQNPGQTGFL